jgi:hypothetical protein
MNQQVIDYLRESLGGAEGPNMVSDDHYIIPR